MTQTPQWARATQTAIYFKSIGGLKADSFQTIGQFAIIDVIGSVEWPTMIIVRLRSIYFRYTHSAHRLTGILKGKQK